MAEYFVVRCNNPDKMKLALAVRDNPANAIKLTDMSQYNYSLTLGCPRIESATELVVSTNFGVITSVTCENIQCPFHALNTDSELTV
ncbi:MAG TPA: hypothetical protein VKC53_04175 [Patescibacteria group bacterium]|nr:hypothetical protein [Patescibacteria group bacterium]